MIVKISTAVRTDRVAAIRAAIDADANPGYIEFYDGTQPPIGGDAITTQTLMGTLVFSTISGSETGGQLVFNAINDDVSADATGTISWCRIYDGAGTFILDGDATDTGGTGFVKFNTVNVQAGGTIKITSATITDGNA